MNCSTPGLPVHHHPLEFTQTHIHRVGDVIQPSHPLSSPSPPAPNPSQHHRVFSNESTLHMRWPKYWSFSFSIIPSKEHPGLLSSRMDWSNLLAVQYNIISLMVQGHIKLKLHFVFTQLFLLLQHLQSHIFSMDKHVLTLNLSVFCQTNYAVCSLLLLAWSPPPASQTGYSSARLSVHSKHLS